MRMMWAAPGFNAQLERVLKGSAWVTAPSTTLCMGVRHNRVDMRSSGQTTTRDVYVLKSGDVLNRVGCELEPT